MDNKTFFYEMGELLRKPVEKLADTNIIEKHVQQFNMNNGERFRVTISKLKKKSNKNGKKIPSIC